MNVPRDWCITHGADDYTVLVFTYKRRSRYTRIFVEVIMSMLGHPCCGGGLGRIEVIATQCNELLAKAFAYEHSQEVVILDLTVTEDQAFTADPRSLDLFNELRNK